MRNLFRLKKAIFPIVFGIILYPVYPAQVSFASDGWLSAGYAVNELRQQRRKGNILASVKCRNNPAANYRLNPQYKFSWKPNNGDKEWMFIYISGNDEWRPGKKPGDEKSWRQVSRKRFAIANTGQTFLCSLWRHKTVDAAKGRKKRVIYAHDELGIKNIEFRQ